MQRLGGYELIELRRTETTKRSEIETVLEYEIESFTEFVESHGQFVIIGRDNVVRGYWELDSFQRDKIELGERAAHELFFASYLD